MLSIQSTPNITTNTYSTGMSTPPTLTSTTGAAYSGDSMTLTTGTPSNTNMPENTDKKAGFFKRFTNGIGNAFGRMADWVGLGTISHFAKENFKALDTDKSNNLNSTEFSAVSALVGKTFEQVDTNTNQEVSFGEFKKIVGDLVDANFKNLDTNSDGFLNYSEANVGGYVVTNGVNNSFTGHDKNQDELLSRNEFAGLVNDMRFKNQPF